MMGKVVVSIFFAVIFLLSSTVYAGTAGVCPPVPEQQWYGPYDYTNPQHREHRLPIVEEYHFTPEIEQLRLPRARYVGDNIDYTLKTFPNHHRALNAMIKLALQEDSTRPPGMDYTLDCWFHRAAQFAPHDGMVHMVHGMYYYEKGELGRAVEKMERGRELEPRNGNILYNLGLVRAKRGEYERARELAEQAYAMGIPLPGLRNQLKRAGHWDD